MNEPWTGLADAIDAVRSELLVAQTRAAGSELPLEVGPIELQFAVAITRGGSANASVKVVVVEAGTGGTLANATTHQVKITLHARGRDGGPVDVSRD